MANIYADKLAETEVKLRELEELRHMCKWASRTGDEADVWPPDRNSWKEKIAWAKSELTKKGVV